MTHTHNSTESTKGKHLTYQDRCQIAILFKEGYTLTQIGQAIGKSRQTVRNEQKRGTITQIRRQKQLGKTHEYDYEIYDADAGQAVYERHRLNCGRRPKWPTRMPL